MFIEVYKIVGRGFVYARDEFFYFISLFFGRLLEGTDFFRGFVIWELLKIFGFGNFEKNL